MKNGIQQSIPVSTSLTLFNYINVNPSFNYTERWYFKKVSQQWNNDTKQLETLDPEYGFWRIYNYNASVSGNTTIYGTYVAKKKHRKLQAVRHTLTPNVGFSYAPDFSRQRYGFYETVQTDTTGRFKVYSPFTDNAYGVPGSGEQLNLTFGISQTLEAKVRTKDTVKKIKLIDQLNFSTGYNFLADSLKMNNDGITMSTSIFGKLGVNANMNFDPYAILVDKANPSGRRINRFAVQEGQGLLRLTNASVSLSYSLSGEGKINGNDGRGQSGSPADHYQRIYYHPITGEYIPGGWLYYTNPNVPWSININYSFSYRKAYQYSNGQVINKKNYTQTVGLSGNVKLTPRLSMNLSTNFDLMALKMSTTQLSATYDLHCFNINVSWIPNGQWESWSFRIQANAAALADLLKFKKSSSYWDNAF
jgi:hypothetical protein